MKKDHHNKTDSTSNVFFPNVLTNPDTQSCNYIGTGSVKCYDDVALCTEAENFFINNVRQFLQQSELRFWETQVDHLVFTAMEECHGPSANLASIAAIALKHRGRSWWLQNQKWHYGSVWATGSIRKDYKELRPWGKTDKEEFFSKIEAFLDQTESSVFFSSPWDEEIWGNEIWSKENRDELDFGIGVTICTFGEFKNCQFIKDKKYIVAIHDLKAFFYWVANDMNRRSFLWGLCFLLLSPFMKMIIPKVSEEKNQFLSFPSFLSAGSCSSSLESLLDKKNPYIKLICIEKNSRVPILELPFEIGSSYPQVKDVLATASRFANDRSNLIQNQFEMKSISFAAEVLDPKQPLPNDKIVAFDKVYIEMELSSEICQKLNVFLQGKNLVEKCYTSAINRIARYVRKADEPALFHFLQENACHLRNYAIFFADSRVDVAFRTAYSLMNSCISAIDENRIKAHTTSLLLLHTFNILEWQIYYFRLFEEDKIFRLFEEDKIMKFSNSFFKLLDLVVKSKNEYLKNYSILREMTWALTWIVASNKGICEDLNEYRKTMGNVFPKEHHEIFLQRKELNPVRIAKPNPGGIQKK